MVKVQDKWLRITGITCIMATAIYSNRFHQQPLTWTVTGRILLTFLSVTLAWEGNRFIILRFREKFSKPDQLIRRLILVFIVGMLFTSAVLLCTSFASNFILYSYQTAINEINTGQTLLHLIRTSLSRSSLLFILFLGIYEAMYYYAKANQTEKEKKQLEKEKLWAQLENLNQQVNPHFLFNTLNSLSALITEDPAEAERFLDEMSKVYRYLLQTNRHELVTLQTEVKFIHSFYQLLKIRYNEGIVLRLHIPDQCHDHLLPPLTLQLLVENAVKHNVTLKAQPLLIEISVTGENRLLIKNTLQKKTTPVLSHKIGLENIAVKYRLMHQGEIIAKEEGGYFMVSVPLIDPGFSGTKAVP